MSSPVLNRVMSEDQLLDATLGAAVLYGWKAHHIRRSDKAQQMGHNGFPDLVIARRGKVLFLELKRQDGKLTEAQQAWSRALFPNWMVIRPADLDWLLEKLA